MGRWVESDLSRNQIGKGWVWELDESRGQMGMGDQTGAEPDGVQGGTRWEWEPDRDWGGARKEQGQMGDVGGVPRQ